MTSSTARAALRVVLIGGSAALLGACATSSSVPTTDAGPAPQQGPPGTIGATPPDSPATLPPPDHPAAGHPAVMTPPTSPGGQQAAQWRGLLEPQGAFTVRGTVTGSSFPTDSTRVAVFIAGGTPGAVYPWHVHTGKCGSNGPVLGNAGLYVPIRVQGNGTGVSDGMVTVRLTSGNNYYVNVHRSATDMGTIVTCGNLTAGQ